MCSTALSVIRNSEVGDAGSGRDWEDTADLISRGPFDQGDQPASGRVARDGACLRVQDAAASEDRALAVGA